MLSISSILPVVSIQYRLVTDGQTDELTDTRRQTPVSLCSLWGSPVALDPDVYWPALLRSLAAYGPGPGTDYQRPSDHQNCHCLHSSASLRPICSSTRQCWLQLLVSCTVVQRCCDCTASSAPTTNVLTRIPR